MRSYADTSSQQARQFAANAAIDAAEAARRRAETTARFRATFAAQQQAAAARRALEERGNFAAVRTGTDYERFVGNILAAAGIATVRVGGSGDCGADLLAETPSGTAVIQCKFYSYPVGYDAVKEAYAAKALYKAAAHTLARPAGSPTANVPSERRSTVHAFVVTNAAFTRQARRTAQQLGVTLTNHAEIAALLHP